MNIKVAIEINSPKATVWAAITDIKNCTKMITGIIDLTIIHQPYEGLIGLKWTETREMFGKPAAETMWITECAEQDSFSTRAENGQAIYLTTMALSSVESDIKKDVNTDGGSEVNNDKTLLTVRFSATSDSLFIRGVSVIMGFFIKKNMVNMLEKDLNDIKSYIEHANN
ncbi:MAG: SRPBCC family protein [Colwellia sp.]|nr:SRPBCC family protein [Colwellia sp.]